MHIEVVLNIFVSCPAVRPLDGREARVRVLGLVDALEDAFCLRRRRLGVAEPREGAEDVGAVGRVRRERVDARGLAADLVRVPQEPA